MEEAMRIGEIEAVTGLSAGTIRYWEDRGLLNISRADNSYREIDDAALKLLERIKLLRELGIAVADIKLWREGIISERELLLGCLKRLENDELSKLKQRELCEKMLAGDEQLEDSDCIDRIFTEALETPGELSLGVDIGTTTISAQLVSLRDGSTLHTYTIEHNAALSDQDSDAFAADADKLIELSLKLVSAAVDSYHEIKAIGFTGQMHGIVCLDSELKCISPLYTWQNRFGLRELDGESICDRIEKICGLRVPTGYGLVTLYALKALGLLPREVSEVCCIADLAALRLCGLKHTVVHPTNAASLGFCNADGTEFDLEALTKLGIDHKILPKISGNTEAIGAYRKIHVSVAIGDNQAGVFGSLADDSYALLNIGTGGQISSVKASEKTCSSDPRCEIRPYFYGKHLYSGSTLCGGRAFALLESFVENILVSFGLSPKKSEVYEYLIEGAMKASPVSQLNISTLFSGSRAEPEKRGSICGITTENFNINELSDGFLRGVIDELYELFCKMNESCNRLVISGNALRSNPALRRAAADRFGCELLTPDHIEEAAFGAALYAAAAAGLKTEEEIKRLISYKMQL